MLCSKLRTAMALLMSLVAWTSIEHAAGQTADKQPQNDPRAVAPDLENLWTDLASTEEARASRALLAFAARPKESAAYLRSRLKPVKADPEQIKKLISQLDDARFPVRKVAFEKLASEAEYLGRFARPFLEQAVKGKEATLEVKRRLEEILKQLPTETKPGAKQPMPPPGVPPLQGRSVAVTSGPGGVQITIDGQVINPAAMMAPVALPPPRPNTQWMRVARAVALLETIGTPEARAALETLATGEPEAPPTQEAKAALERLAKSKQP